MSCRPRPPRGLTFSLERSNGSGRKKNTPTNPRNNVISPIMMCCCLLHHCLIDMHTRILRRLHLSYQSNDDGILSCSLQHDTWTHLSCLVLSCLVLSCLVSSCLALPCLVLSCLVLSRLVLQGDTDARGDQLAGSGCVGERGHSGVSISGAAESSDGSLARRIRGRGAKTHASCAPFYTKNDHFTDTGSGQT